MKHTAVLLSLLAVATAAKLPNASPDIADVFARHDGHHQQNTTTLSDGHDQDLEKRRGGGAGGAGGSHGSGAGGAHGSGAGTGSHSSTGCTGSNCNRPKSGASVLMSLNVGLLVAGVTGASIGATFL